jgi:hypothetical protein
MCSGAVKKAGAVAILGALTALFALQPEDAREFEGS